MPGYGRAGQQLLATVGVRLAAPGSVDARLLTRLCSRAGFLEDVGRGPARGGAGTRTAGASAGGTGGSGTGQASSVPPKRVR
jgi:hypothetical protein